MAPKSLIMAAGLAVASVIPMVAATTTAQSTKVNILFPALNQMNLDDLEGSIVSADATATTIEIDCRSSVTNQCLSSGYVLPQTLTAGPSIQDYHYEITSYYNHAIYIVTGNMDCNVTGSTLGASCVFSTSTWISSGLNSTSSVYSTAVSISSFNLKYNTLAVPSGLENLPSQTAATNAFPGSTGTSTSTATTTPTTTAVTTPEHHTSSKAWIAGPVIGGVAGVALAFALAFWCVSRRRKADTDPAYGPVYWNPTGGAQEVSQHQPYIPEQHNQVEELPTKSAVSELSDQYKPHEMP